MFRALKRKDREVFKEDIEEIINNGEYGTLATIGENGYPYSVPVNYVYYNDSIYFHGAKSGYKLDNIKNNNKVSFSIVTDTEVVGDKFTENYKSVIIFGTAKEVIEEKEEVLYKFLEKYSENFLEEGKKYIEAAKNAVTIVRIDIENVTGKVKGN